MTIRGVIRGKIIELETEPGLPDGQTVAVDVRPVLPSSSPAETPRLPPGEGIRQSAGAWADAGPALDVWLEDLQRSRQRNRAEPK